MNINDLVLPIETCKRLKETGYEFPDSVFVWEIDYKYQPNHEIFVIERQEFVGYSDEDLENKEFTDTLTLHEIYCWILELSKISQFRGDTPIIKFVYGDTNMEDRIIFSAGSQTNTGRSSELNPLIAADRYINNLLDNGVLKK